VGMRRQPIRRRGRRQEVVRCEVCAVRCSVQHIAKRLSTRIQKEERGGELESTHRA
jgi:hypothetical protein